MIVASSRLQLIPSTFISVAVRNPPIPNAYQPTNRHQSPSIEAKLYPVKALVTQDAPKSVVTEPFVAMAMLKGRQILSAPASATTTRRTAEHHSHQPDKAGHISTTPWSVPPGCLLQPFDQSQRTYRRNTPPKCVAFTAIHHFSCTRPSAQPSRHHPRRKGIAKIHCGYSPWLDP
jgi:hypothetical protein